ncbi:MAG: hypothetical protein ACJ8EY_06960, partial [Sphingomicrobium sp.]
GSIGRPLLVHLMILSLALVTIRDVWKDLKRNGWESPYRFRRGKNSSQPVAPGAPSTETLSAGIPQ